MIKDNPLITISLGKRITDGDFQFNWQEIDLDETSEIIDKPIVLVLGGSGTETTRQANGMAKILEGFIGKINEPVDIISVAYGNLNDSNENENISLLVEKMLVPLVCENNQRLSLERAMKKMRRINVFSHCAGTSRFDEMLNILTKRMRDLDYSSDEVELILGQVFVLGYAPNDYIKNSKVSQVYIQSIFDESLENSHQRMRNLQLQAKKHKTEIKVSPSEFEVEEFETLKEYASRVNDLAQESECLVSVLCENVLHYFTSSQVQEGEGFDHTLMHIERDEKFNVSEFSSFVADVVSVLISEIMIKYIALSIDNEHSTKPVKMPTMEELKSECDSIINQMQINNFENQINY